jgi:hypothetical protein
VDRKRELEVERASSISVSIHRTPGVNTFKIYTCVRGSSSASRRRAAESACRKRSVCS